MSGHMIQGAVVEPDSLRRMKEKIDMLAEDLARKSKELINRTEELNQKGFQDQNFESLYRIITERKVDLEKLKNIMISFSEYLVEVERNIRKLVESEKIRSNFNLNL
jgi:hypothetical protein